MPSNISNNSNMNKNEEPEFFRMKLKKAPKPIDYECPHNSGQGDTLLTKLQTGHDEGRGMVQGIVQHEHDRVEEKIRMSGSMGSMVMPDRMASRSQTVTHEQNEEEHALEDEQHEHHRHHQDEEEHMNVDEEYQQYDEQPAGEQDAHHGEDAGAEDTDSADY